MDTKETKQHTRLKITAGVVIGFILGLLFCHICHHFDIKQMIGLGSTVQPAELDTERASTTPLEIEKSEVAEIPKKPTKPEPVPPQDTGTSIDTNPNPSPSCTEQAWYRDADEDGYGDQNDEKKSCTQPAGYTTDNTDVNDTDANSYPGAPDADCDGIDNDGDGAIDEDATQLLYRDKDGDGYGDPNDFETLACGDHEGFTANNTDFNDTDAQAHPDVAEICNNIDDNGNGTIDENATDCGAGESCSAGMCVPTSFVCSYDEDCPMSTPTCMVASGDTIGVCQ